MPGKSFFKSLAITLLVLVVTLLIVNVVITKYAEKGERPKYREVLSGVEIDSLFNLALSNFGFSKNWVTKKKLRQVSGDSLYSTYTVAFPKDVPIHNILLELKNMMWDYDVEIKAEEFNKTDKTLIKINSGNDIKLAAECSYDENIKRAFGTISFLIKDIPVDNPEILTSLLSTPELFYVVLIPSEASKKMLPELTKSNRRFALMLDDNITELSYKFSDKYSDDKIKKSVKEIVGDFYNAAFFIFDDRSDLYESKKFRLIESELYKRGIKLISSADLNLLPTSSGSTENNFNDYLKSLTAADEKVLIVTYEEFSSILPLIPKYRKTGYKFIYPGDLISRK